MLVCTYMYYTPFVRMLYMSKRQKQFTNSSEIRVKPLADDLLPIGPVCSSVFSNFGIPTPQKINMAPENTPLEEENHLLNPHVFRFYLSLRGCVTNLKGNKSQSYRQNERQESPNHTQLFIPQTQDFLSWNSPLLLMLQKSGKLTQLMSW